ncbi:transposase [Streptomyces cirratus]
MPERRRYPSDLSDARWELVESVLTAWRSRPGHRPATRHDLRSLLDAVLYVNWTWLPWRCLPHDYLLVTWNQHRWIRAWRSHRPRPGSVAGRDRGPQRRPLFRQPRPGAAAHSWRSGYAACWAKPTHSPRAHR